MPSIKSRPGAPPISAPATVSKFIKTALRYAEELIENGRYSDAEKVAKTILLPDYDPSNKAAIRLLSNLEQPDYYNKTVTPDFAEDREEVTKLLYEADGFYQAGRFDLAIKRYEQVLNIDRYNIAARKGMEQVNLAKARYYGAAYNETRSRLLWLVDKSWERPVHRFQRGRTTTADIQARGGVRGTEATMAKLNRIIIPRIDLRDTTVREAVEFLKQRSRELDTSTDDPQGKRGVNIVLKLNPSQPDLTLPPAEGPTAPLGGTADSRVTLSLTNVPLIEALRYLTELAGLKYKIEPYAVSIVPITENTTDLVTKKFGSRPDFSRLADRGPAKSRHRVRNVMRSRSPASEAGRMPSNICNPRASLSRAAPLHNTSRPAANSSFAIRQMPSISSTRSWTPPSASSRRRWKSNRNSSRSPKITSTSSGLTGSLDRCDRKHRRLRGGRNPGVSGLTSDSRPSRIRRTFPLLLLEVVPVGQNPVTGGLRSGSGFGPNAAITANSIDALLGTTVIGMAPGIFGRSRRIHEPAMSGCHSGLEPEERCRSDVGSKGYHQEWPQGDRACRSRISVSNRI